MRGQRLRGECQPLEVMLGRLGTSILIASGARAIRASVFVTSTARTRSILIGTEATPVFIAFLRESRTTYLMRVVGWGRDVFDTPHTTET